MKGCKECGATWNSNKHIDVCPFCGANLKNSKIADRVEDAFALIIEEYGPSVFLNGNRFLGLLSDYAPRLTNERKLVRIAIEAGAYKALYEAAESEKKQIANKYISILEDSFFVDRKWAKTAMMWCLSVIAPELTEEGIEAPKITINNKKNSLLEDTVNIQQKSKYTLGEPKTSGSNRREFPENYYETILEESEVEVKIKDNKGYGIVRCRFEPFEEYKIVFESSITDSSIPQLYIHTIENTIIEASKTGVIARYPVVGVKVILIGGAYHPCTSTKKAFERAAKQAFIVGISKAHPVLLEAIGLTTIDVSDEKIADVIDDINNRRGCVVRIGVSKKNNWSIVEAEIPLPELKDYANTLSSIAGPDSKFDVEFKEYVQVPVNA